MESLWRTGEAHVLLRCPTSSVAQKAPSLGSETFPMVVIEMNASPNQGSSRRSVLQSLRLARREDLLQPAILRQAGDPTRSQNRFCRVRWKLAILSAVCARASSGPDAGSDPSPKFSFQIVQFLLLRLGVALSRILWGVSVLVELERVKSRRTRSTGVTLPSELVRALESIPRSAQAPIQLARQARVRLLMARRAPVEVPRACKVRSSNPLRVESADCPGARNQRGDRSLGHFAPARPETFEEQPRRTSRRRRRWNSEHRPDFFAPFPLRLPTWELLEEFANRLYNPCASGRRLQEVQERSPTAPNQSARSVRSNPDFNSLPNDARPNRGLWYWSRETRGSASPQAGGEAHRRTQFSPQDRSYRLRGAPRTQAASASKPKLLLRERPPRE